MSDTAYMLFAGLGNPGKEYARTRHNIGFMVMDALAGKSALTFDKTRFNAEYVKTRIMGRHIVLVKPLTFMNRSGLSIQQFVAWYNIDIPDIVVVHDDMDLEFSRLKIVKSRGHGGHNGVRSILEAFGNPDCTRIRVGVGHPADGKEVTGHVLGGFLPQEAGALEKTIDAAVCACRHIIEKGVVSAMNAFNQSPGRP